MCGHDYRKNNKEKYDKNMELATSVYISISAGRYTGICSNLRYFIDTGFNTGSLLKYSHTVFIKILLVVVSSFLKWRISNMKKNLNYPSFMKREELLCKFGHFLG